MVGSIQCRLCAADLIPYLHMPIDAKKDEETPFSEVLRCPNCGIAMISPQPAPAEIHGFYRLSQYYTHGEGHMRPVEPTLFDRALTKLAWLVDRPTSFDVAAMAKRLPSGGSVCDLGCGHAHLLKQFKALGFEVVGVEPDPLSREAAIKAGITVLNGTAEEPGLDRQFDLVTMTHSLEHCLDPFTALRNAYLLTKPGGYFYCEVPNSGCLHFKAFTTCSEMFDSPRHLWFFTAAGLRQAMTSANFAFDRWCFDGFTRHHSPSWRAWELTIADRLAKRSAKGTRHTYWRSLILLAVSALAGASYKYDCVGIIARRLA